MFLSCMGPLPNPPSLSRLLLRTCQRSARAWLHEPHGSLSLAEIDTHVWTLSQHWERTCSSAWAASLGSAAPGAPGRRLWLRRPKRGQRHCTLSTMAALHMGQVAFRPCLCGDRAVTRHAASEDMCLVTVYERQVACSPLLLQAVLHSSSCCCCCCCCHAQPGDTAWRLAVPSAACREGG